MAFENESSELSRYVIEFEETPPKIYRVVKKRKYTKKKK